MYQVKEYLKAVVGSTSSNFYQVECPVFARFSTHKDPEQADLAVHNAVEDDKNCKLGPLPTPTMVLKVFWLDVGWEEQHYDHPLSQFHGPRG